jgi:hypothetical protein
MAYVKNFKTFEQWHAWDVTQKFGIGRVNTCDSFQQWINVTPELPPFWQPYVAILREKLINFHSSWNETELLAHFIIPFMDTVQWQGDNFNLFNERPLRATVKGYPVSGVVDGMVASGYYEPYHPYFFLQEYKRLQKGEPDPLGQVLVAMLVAREINQSDDPVYGCYVIGNAWRFVLLEGESYCLSQGYDVTDETEIQIVWAILNQTKKYVEVRAARDHPVH